MDQYKEIFNKYYSQFDSNEYWIKYKYDHTMRVVEYAKELANKMNLSDEDKNMVEVCALLHDIARFKQWSTYKTLIDADSFNHGDEGYNILKELGIDDEMILTCTKIHNKYQVPDEFDEHTKLICNIIRDADKIDILLDHVNTLKYDTFDIPEEVVQAFRDYIMVPNALTANKGDTLAMLRCFGFIFDLKFKESFKIIKESNIVNDMFDPMIEASHNKYIKEIKDILNKYIDERISD